MLPVRRATAAVTPPTALGNQRAAERGSAIDQAQPQGLQQPNIEFPSSNLFSKLQEKQGQLLQQSLEPKLPCNSGRSLIAVESDDITEKVVHGFIDLGISNVDLSVATLCSMLEKLTTRAFPDGSFPEQVLDSALYILKIITRVLYARWPSADPVTTLTPSSSTGKPAATRLHEFVAASASISLSASQQPFNVLQPHSSSHTSGHNDTRSHRNNPHARPSIASIRSVSTTSSSSTCWRGPGPLTETTVTYVLQVLKNTVLHPSGGLDLPVDKPEPDMFPWDVVDWEPSLSPSSCAPRLPPRPPPPAGNNEERVGEFQPSTNSLDTKRQKRRLSRDPIEDLDRGQSRFTSPGGEKAHLNKDPVDDQGTSCSTGPVAEGEGDMDPQRNRHTARSPPVANESIFDEEGRCRYTVYTHDFTRDVELHGSYLASVPVLIGRYTAHIIYILSASNWPFVLSMVKTSFRVLTMEHKNKDLASLNFHNKASPQLNIPSRSRSQSNSYASKTFKSLGAALIAQKDTATELPPAMNIFNPDLRIVEYCVMDRTRLISILQEYTRFFHDITIYEAQEKAAFALRMAVLHWVDNFPGEFAELWAGYTTSSSLAGKHGTTSDGIPEHLFDTMVQQAMEDSRKGAILYPALTVLLCICPDRFRLAMAATERQSDGRISTKMNLFQQLQQALLKTPPKSGSSGPNMAEQATIAYLDLIRLSFSIPPRSNGEDEFIIKNVGVDKANDLVKHLLQPPNSRIPFYVSSEPIDVNFYAHCMAAMYRLNPKQSLQLMEVSLAAERSYAVKLCVVKALILLTVEATKYPWQLCLDMLCPVIAPRLRDVLKSCMLDIPEVINGQTCVPATVPVCKALAEAGGTNDNMASVINERTRLLVQIQTLRSLEPSLWFYGASDADYVCPSNINYRRINARRDRCERAAFILAQGAIFARALNTSPEEKCYNEAKEYIRICAPFCFMSAAMMVLHSADDRDMQRLGINSLRAKLGYLAYGSKYDTDDANSWRFSPEMKKMMSFVEVAIWTTLPSAINDISAIGQECLLLVNVWERHPAVPRAANLSARQFSGRCAMMEALISTQDIITGRQAFQKQLRKQVVSLEYLSSPHLLAAKVTMLRFRVLQSRMDQLPADQISTYSRHEDFHEWQNILYAMSAGAYMGMEFSHEAFPAEFESLLPSLLQVQPHGHDGVRGFISDTIGLLTSNVLARESAKEALGNELNITAMPILFECLDDVMGKWMAKELIFCPAAHELVFVEQILMVLKMVFERLDDNPAIFGNRASENCLAIGNFIKDNAVGDVQLRLKIRYSATISLLLSKRCCFGIRDENEFRCELCDILCAWIEQDTCVSTVSSHFSRLIQEARIATMKLLVLCVETLVVSSNLSQDLDCTLPALSQKANHYISIFLSTVNEPPSAAVTSPTSSTRSFAAKISSDADLVRQLAVQGISHILKNNCEACKEFCVSQCYDDNPNIHIVCMQAFARVFGLGIRFDQLQAVVPSDQQNPICQLIRKSEMLALSVVQSCPPNEVEAMVPVFIRLFDTPNALLDFLKIMIDGEIVKTDDPSQLLRSNNICTRMLSIVAREHAYEYLRVNVEFLVNNLAKTTEYSYETDLARTSPEDAMRNVRILVKNAGAFMGELFRTIDKVPYMIRKMSHYIFDAVSKRWPESKYPALGAFIFLRMIVPTIATPDISLNIVIGDDRQRIRRGLLVVAKILQSLSNQMGFGQSPVVKEINQFLEDNVQTMVDYLIQIQTVPSKTAQDVHGNSNINFDDTDALILHRFVNAHTDGIGHSLLSRVVFDNDPQIPTPKQVWDALCTALVDTRMSLELPRLTLDDQTHHKPYQRFMSKNKNRATTALVETCTLHVGTKVPVFVLTFSRINTDAVDFELLLFLIFKASTTLGAPRLQRSQFDVIFDFSAFTYRSVLPIAWLKLAIELLPADIRNRWRSTYLLNLSSAGQSFLRKLSASFSGLDIVKQVITVSSIAELRQYFPHVTSLLSTSISMSLRNESPATFDSVHYQLGDQPWSLGTIHVGLEYIRIASVNRKDANVTEFIHFQEVDDIYKGSSKKYIFLQHSHRGLCIKLETASAESLFQVIQGAKQRFARSNKCLLPAVRSSNVSAALLVVGLFHACSSSESVRKAAYELLRAHCKCLGCTFDGPLSQKNTHLPANTLAFVRPFADRISAFAPQMTLDFILEWAGSFSCATITRKIDCLQYLSYWLRFCELFLNAGNELYDNEKLRRCIRVLISITVQHYEIFPLCQKFIWSQIANQSSPVLLFVLNELILMAINYGPESERCEIIAETLITLSSVAIRKKLLTELIARIAEACRKPVKTIMNASEWDAICALSRLCMVSGNNPKGSFQNCLCAPEICHVICMLAGIGSFAMRDAIYSLTTNLLDALCEARQNDEPAALQLRTIMTKMSEPEYLKLFGLSQQDPTGPKSLLDATASEISVEALEGITELLKQALELGSPNIGNNTRRARWMSLLFATTFQPAAHAQYRGFIILGCLVESDIRDDLFHEMLEVFKRNMLQPDENAHASEALVRCMHRLVPALQRDSKYLPSLFWLAISLHQAVHIPFRGEATQLLQACIETMDKRGFFNLDSVNDRNAVAVLMKARKPLSAALERLEHLSEISFDFDFNFALIAALWYDVRNGAEITRIKRVLTNLLRIIVKSSNPAGEKRQCLDSLTMPLFLGLAPCFDKIAYKRFLEDECHVVGSSSIPNCLDPLDDDETVYPIDVKTLGLSDTTALLAVGFLTCAGDNQVLGKQAQENIHLLCGMFAKAYPEQLAAGLWHNMEMIPPGPLANKMDMVFGTSMSKAHRTAVSAAFDIVMTASSAQWTSTMHNTPGASNSSLGLESTQTEYFNGDPEVSQTTSYRDKFKELGMRGILEPFRRVNEHQDMLPAYKGNTERTKQVFPALVDLMELLQK